MKLKDCELQVDLLYSSGKKFTVLDRQWEEDCDRCKIPRGLVTFFRRAEGFLWQKAPSYLRDNQSRLFPYLEAMTSGVRGSLVEAERQKSLIPLLLYRSYDPIKTLEHNVESAEWGRRYQEVANELQNTFKYLLLNLSSALDGLAEVIALMFYPLLEKPKSVFELGRADFSKVQELFKAKEDTSSLIIDPTVYHLQEVVMSLRRHIEIENKDHEWYALFRFYRNKLSHIGTSVFEIMCFHDKQNNFYQFLPKVWPNYIKQDVEPKEELGNNQNESDLREALCKNLIHIDIGEYSEGIFSKVFTLTGDVFDKLSEAYINLSVLPPNEEAAECLSRRSKSFSFTDFEIQ